MNAMAECPKDHPLMIAWEKYKATEDAANTFKWAKAPLDYFDDEDIPEPKNGGNKWRKYNMEQAIDGSLWAAFMAGFMAAGGKISV